MDQKKVTLAMLTALGAFGGFPPAPKSFDSMLKRCGMLRWVLLFVLIYQGGGGQDPQLSAAVTVAVFVIHSLIAAREELE